MSVEETQAIIFSFFFCENREDIIRLDFNVATGNDQFAAGFAYRDEDEIFHFEFTDFVTYDGSTLFSNDVKYGAAGNRGKLLEWGFWVQ